jgi:hypothetical protein
MTPDRSALGRAVFAVDPGTTHSGYVAYCGGTVRESGVVENGEMLKMLAWPRRDTDYAIEMIASYGMAVGAEVFETCVWIGRMVQVAGPERVRLVYRKDVKMHLCASPRAKDANIRQAIIDLYGGKAEAIGTSKRPGPLHGVKSHAWAALAVAITAANT